MANPRTYVDLFGNEMPTPEEVAAQQAQAVAKNSGGDMFAILGNMVRQRRINRGEIKDPWQDRARKIQEANTAILKTAQDQGVDFQKDPRAFADLAVKHFVDAGMPREAMMASQWGQMREAMNRDAERQQAQTIELQAKAGKDLSQFTPESKAKWSQTKDPADLVLDPAAAHTGSQAKLIVKDRVTEEGQLVTDFYDPYTGGLIKQIANGGKAIPAHVLKRFNDSAGAYGTYRGLSDTFDDNYGGTGFKTVGDAREAYKKRFSDDTKFVKWWQNYQMQVQFIRNELYGTALSKHEQEQYERLIVDPSMAPEQIRENLASQAEILRASAQRQSRPYASGRWDSTALKESLGPYASDILFKPAQKMSDIINNPQDPKNPKNANPTHRPGGAPQAGEKVYVNPQTGQRIVKRDGKWVTLTPASK